MGKEGWTILLRLKRTALIAALVVWWTVNGTALSWMLAIVILGVGMADHFPPNVDPITGLVLVFLLIGFVVATVLMTKQFKTMFTPPRS